MLLTLPIKGEDFPVSRVRVVVDWGRMPRDEKHMPIGPMPVMVEIEARALLFKHRHVIEKRPEQYAAIKTLVKLLKLMDYEVQRDEINPLLVFGQKYSIWEVELRQALRTRLLATVKAGTRFPYDDVGFTGVNVALQKSTTGKWFDDKEFAFLLTELLGFCGIEAKTTLEVEKEKPDGGEVLPRNKV